MSGDRGDSRRAAEPGECGPGEAATTPEQREPREQKPKRKSERERQIEREQSGPPARPKPSVPPVAPGTGARIITASLAGTALLLVTAVLSVSVEAFDLIAAIVDLGLFAGGAVIFLWAYGIAVGRSRTDEIGIGGLYFLQGTAPKDVRVRLMGSLVAEVVIAFTAAGIRPFSSVAFAILAPMWGLGLAGLWGAKFGHFGRRTRP